VRGLLVGITGLLGAAAFWRRRRKRAQELPAAETGPDPAEELRAKLAESRAADEQEPADDRKPAVDPDASPLDPEVRRQSVHDRARSSIDELG
jgi:hypothetical protein